MRRQSASLSIAVCALLTSACAPRAPLFADRPPGDASELHDVKVYAGDRLEIDHQAITLSDAETPQPGPRALCRAEAMIAAQVADAVRTTLAGARHIEVRPANGPGGMKLVSVDGLDLGLSLIDQGLAVSRRPRPMDWCVRGAMRG